ncbi:E3 ubiquitin-protein ligase MARCHF4-like [Rhopilema esculentum]|uniref:E3 ubiquitin-protein ligase MARCHF4-like n=1 Tax=Rhopilema esculentum TaxID=499914 RepID=UPI0031CE10DA|eukprot:gene7764-13607_t
MNLPADTLDQCACDRFEHVSNIKGEEETSNGMPDTGNTLRSQGSITCCDEVKESPLLKGCSNDPESCLNQQKEEEISDMDEKCTVPSEETLLNQTNLQTSCLQVCSSSLSINLHQNYELPLDDQHHRKCNSSKTDFDKLKCKPSVRLSLISGSSLEGSCRICHCDGQEEQLISPCRCSGSLQYVHESCLVQWLQSKMVQNCELCQARIEFARRIKPVWLWKRPTQRPSSVLWFLLFVVTIHLNVISVVKDASNKCISTPCIVFYIVGCIGAILATAFSIYFGKRVKDFFRHWININEEWVIVTKNSKKGSQKSGNQDRFLTHILSMFSSNRLTTIV